MKDEYIFPCLIDKHDEVTFSDGILYKLKPELGGSVKIRQYISQTRLGWHRIDFGHSMLIHRSDELGFIRFIGLLFTDSGPTKLSGPALPFSKGDFENYVQSLVDVERRKHDSIKNEIALLIHDLRRFSNSIYQNAVATKKALFDGDGEEALTKIENTLAAQAMLSIRTDILDLAESRETQLDEERVPVYRKFDKVVKSFQPGSSLKNIDLAISGSSHSVVLGPDCVEIIAYILIDNALKYSPSNHRIEVKVSENSSDVEIQVISLGPIIELDEVESIFEKGVRSRAARNIEASGTGYGLYLAKSLVSRFKGTITAEQVGSTITTVKGTYRDTFFKVSFPIHQKLERPVHVHLERKGPARQLVPPKKGTRSPKKLSHPQKMIPKDPPLSPSPSSQENKIEASKSLDREKKDGRRRRWGNRRSPATKPSAP